MTASPITDVSDTAFWIAQVRADETARDDAFFRDPLTMLAMWIWMLMRSKEQRDELRKSPAYVLLGPCGSGSAAAKE